MRHRPGAGASQGLRTVTIITTEANDLCRPIHNRMPVIVDPADHALWLGEVPAEPEALKSLLRPYPAERMEAWPVSTRVNNVRNDEPSLLDPA